MRRAICTGLSLCGRPKALSRPGNWRNSKGGKLFALAIAAARGLAGIISSSEAEAQTVNLGAAGAFAVLGATTVTNVPTSHITGDVGVWPGTAITGITPGDGQVDGTLHAGDAVAAQAQAANTAAYLFLQGIPGATSLGPELGGQTLVGGVYSFTSDATLSTVLTLDGQGNSASRWVFQIPANLNVANDASIVFIGGANPRNLYWAVGASAVIGTNATFAGNILALTSISLNTGASLICGRALAQNGAVTLQQNTITVCVTNDEGGGDTGDIPIDELGGEGVTGTEQTAFDASRLFGSTMLAQTVFPYLAVGGPGLAHLARARKATVLKNTRL